MENYDFLETSLSERMIYFAISNFLSLYANTKKKEYRKNGEISPEDFYTLSILNIAFIDQCEINGSTCTFEEIKKFNEIYIRKHNINVDVHELVKDIVINCFQNGGVINNFVSSFCNKPININLIYSDKKYSANLTTYRLTQNSRMWLYSSYEYQQIGQIKLDTLIMQKHIFSGNFDRAKDTAKNLFLSQSKRLEELEKLSREIINDVNDFTWDRISAELDDKYNKFEEEKKDIEFIDNLINKIISGDYSDIKSGDKNYVLDCMTIVRQLKEKVKDIIVMQQKLISKSKDLRTLYDEQLLKTDFLFEKKYINVAKDILQPIKKNPTVEFDLYSLLSPFLNIRPTKHFCPNDIFKKQLIFNNELELAVVEDDGAEIMEEEESFDFEEINKLYSDIWEAFLSVLETKKEYWVSEIVNASIFKNNLDALKVVLATIVDEGEIRLSVINDLIENSSAKFNSKNILLFDYKLKEKIDGCLVKVSFDSNSLVNIVGKTTDNLDAKFNFNDIKLELWRGEK